VKPRFLGAALNVEVECDWPMEGDTFVLFRIDGRRIMWIVCA